MEGQSAGIERDKASARLAIELASFATGVAAQQIARPSRGRAEAAAARQLAMYLAHVGFSMSLQRVAQAFGRDRSTVAYACHKIEDRRDEERFDRQVEALEELLRNAPPMGALQ